MDKEIREVYGKKYEVTKVPCTCYCHRSKNFYIKFPHLLHIAACCDNGWVEILREVNN